MNSQSKLWWQKPLRVIQPNLQVRDTHLIDPEKLADQMHEMGANTMVFNVGGIYAWYHTQVKYHYENEFLPQGDLLKQVIVACHKRNIKFVARFDFSKADDSIYLQRPHWFTRDPLGEPEITGSKRPGQWSLLMSTCINSGYRNDAVAIPVLDEVMTKYDIDGIFFNAPGFIPCHCNTCQKKYAERYNQELPEDPKNYEESWASTCLRDNMDNIYKFIKGKNEDVPMILYYNLYHDNLFDREQTTDMLCTEPQDILSLGHKKIPEFWKPALSIKVGKSLPHRPRPFGIVHSSPGMDWRHTGLPSAEYLFWMSQIPANGGQIWHSLTGIPDTIGDKRILKTVTTLNQMAKKVEDYIDGAESLSQVALMWNADRSAEGWADGLINKQIPFDVLLDEQAVVERLKKFKVVVIPENYNYKESFANELKAYVQQGGNLIIEGGIPDSFNSFKEMAGINNDVYTSESLLASYLRFEGDQNPLQKNLEETELIAHRGHVNYCTPRDGAKVLATLVPPFSPLDGVGRPPERASLPVSHTDIPLSLVNNYGQGKVLYLPFSLSELINDYKLEEHYIFLANAIDMMLDGETFIEVTNYQGLQVTAFEKEDNIIVNLVNGSGRRPLSTNIPLHNITVKLKVDTAKIKNVQRIISNEEVEFTQKGQYVEIKIVELKVWDALLIEV
jgi:hypothetical protein